MDIAQIGFKADTSDLDKAVVKLNAIRPAAAGAAAGADKLQASVEGASAAIVTASVAAAKAEQTRAAAILRAVQANQKSTKDEIAKATALKRTADAALAAARAERDQVAAAKLASAAAKKTEVAALAVAAAYKQQTTAARMAFNAAASGSRNTAGGGPMPANDQMPNRFNTANIAAQFQDIGVTAAMGMNPMTIALQQGTQLSAILQSMENPLKGLAVAFGQIFNSISLGTIAIVGLVAAGLQMVNWTATAKAAVNGLAVVVKEAGPYFVALAASMLLIAAPRIVTALQAVALWISRTGLAAVAAGAQIAAAWVIALGPIAWLIAGITAIVMALNIFREKMTKVFGFDLVKTIKDAVNKSIGFFVGFFEGIVSAAKNLPERLRHPFSDSGKTMADAFKEGFDKGLTRDYIGAIADPIVAGADAAAEKLKKIADGIGKDTKGEKKWESIITGAEKTIETLKAEQAALGLSSMAAAQLRYETDLLNDARQKGIDLSPRQRAELKALAVTMAETSEATRKIKEALEFTKETAKGFFSDLRSNLREGQSLWEAFGNAVQNVLDKILDKLADKMFDELFEGAGGGAGGSGFSGIVSSIAGWLFNAKGNAFDGGGVTGFAKGGAFTNSVVSKPTMFAFGSGGTFGVMGEKGPEAVMPLKRGSDGSLGVQVQDNNSERVTVNVINNSTGTKTSQQRRKTSNGLEVDVLIDDVVASKMGEKGTSTNRQLGALSGRQLIGR